MHTVDTPGRQDARYHCKISKDCLTDKTSQVYFATPHLWIVKFSKFAYLTESVAGTLIISPRAKHYVNKA